MLRLHLSEQRLASCGSPFFVLLGLRQALQLCLRVTDGLGQHLAQLSLRLRWLAGDGFLPLGHE